ncbi:hypothetical protein N4T77_06345 [Clostridium sp. CX1]|uniref:hypothetical protein n=1 Tax=Clostridium sp. CX1 TaxID=2978346 RepID=UPI0021C01A6A|nr:hypothetical protein [Clostridium sp. CX1]MCT8976213.1 hypothetical protein [Clostridium sp. CX1]
MDILILLLIIILVIFISRNNLKKRTEELTNNLENFNKEIRKSFTDMCELKQEELLNSLTPKHRNILNSILENNFNYAGNHWAIQQQIFQQQELFMELNKLREARK